MGNRLITHFHLRNGIIYLRLTFNGARTDMSTNHRINPSLWSKSLQKVKGKEEKAYLVNASLNTLLGKVMKIFNDMDMNNESLSVNKIINRLKDKDISQMTLFKAYEFHIACISELVGIDYTATTVKRYKSSLNSLKRYRDNLDIKLKDLDYNFILGYHTYIKSVEGLKHNSAAKNIKNLYGVVWIKESIKKHLGINIY